MKKIGLIALISFIIDRVIKIIVDNSLKPFIEYKIVDDFLYLLKCNNEGAAFSILSGSTIFLILITIVALYLIINFIRKEEQNKLSIVSYGILIGGIIGNLYDRIVYGSVIDYIGINIFNYNFPIFNFADITIVIGAFIILFIEFRGEKIEKSNS